MHKTRITMNGKIKEYKLREPTKKYFYCIPEENIKTLGDVISCYKCSGGEKEFDCPAILLDPKQTAYYEKELEKIIKGEEK